MEPGQVVHPDNDAPPSQNPSGADSQSVPPSPASSNPAQNSSASLNQPVKDVGDPGQASTVKNPSADPKIFVRAKGKSIQPPPPKPPLSLDDEELTSAQAEAKAPLEAAPSEGLADLKPEVAKVAEQPPSSNSPIVTPAVPITDKNDLANNPTVSFGSADSDATKAPADTATDITQLEGQSGVSTDTGPSGQTSAAMADLNPSSITNNPVPRSPQDPQPEPLGDPNEPNPSKLEETADDSDKSDGNDKSNPPGSSDNLPPSDSPPLPPPPTNSDAPLLTWEASEYASHHHALSWYIGLIVASSALVAFSIFILKEWLSTVLIVVMMAAVAVYAKRQPAVLRYELSAGGIRIGDKFYSYSDFRGFGIVPHNAFVTIELDPLRRFMPRLSMFFEPNDEDTILDILDRRLPRNDRQADPVDRLAHFLKF